MCPPVTGVEVSRCSGSLAFLSLFTGLLTCLGDEKESKMLAFVFHKFWGTSEGSDLSLRLTQEFWGPLATAALVMVSVTLYADICGTSALWHPCLSLSSHLPSYHIWAQLDGLLRPGHKAEMLTTGLTLRFQISSVLLIVLNCTHHQDWPGPVTGLGKWIWRTQDRVNLNEITTDQPKVSQHHTHKECQVRKQSQLSSPCLNLDMQAIIHSSWMLWKLCCLFLGITDNSWQIQSIAQFVILPVHIFGLSSCKIMKYLWEKKW